MEYEFLFVVEGVSVDDDQAVTTLTDTFDAQLSWHRGINRLAVCAEGGNAPDAFQSLLPRLIQALPDLMLVRLDPDLVGVSDIAERTDRTRQNVQQWVEGDRNTEQPFPAPEGTVGRSLAWRWADVNEWLATIGLGDGENRPSREEAALIEFTLHGWRRAQAQGLPMIRFVTAGDERFDERQEVARRLGQAITDPAFLSGITAWPRDTPHQLVVICALPLDPIKFVIEQMGGDTMAGLAVLTGDTELTVTPITSVLRPWAVPISTLGLTEGATVGDLLLALRQGQMAAVTPLTLN